MKKILLLFAGLALASCAVETHGDRTTIRFSDAVIKAIDGKPPKKNKTSVLKKDKKTLIQECQDWCFSEGGPKGVSGLTSCVKSCEDDYK